MRADITVTLPRGFSRLMLGGSALLALVPVGFALAGDLPPVGAVAFALIIAPIVLAGMLGPRYRVAVRQGAVSIRPCVGRAWDFAFADVTRVVRRVNLAGDEPMTTKMVIHACGRRVSVEALMCGSEEFWEHVEKSVSPEKIVTKYFGRGGQ